MSNVLMKKWTDQLNKNKVSFIIPTVQHRVYFLEKLLEVLRERVPLLLEIGVEYEIIIVFDGFLPPVNILNKYQSLNIITVCFPEQTGTVSIPRNIGISYATGSIIAPTDDDVHPTYNKMYMIKSLIESRKTKTLGMHGNEIGLIYGSRCERFLEKDQNLNSYNFSNTININRDFYVNINNWTVNKKNLGIDNGQFVYTADIYNKVNINFPVNACDWELYSLIADHYDFDCFNNKQDVCIYYWHDKNISRTPKEYRINPMSILHKYVDYFAPNEWRETISLMVNFLNWNKK